MATSSGPGGMTLSQGGVAWRCVDLLLSMPAGGRILVVGVVVLASSGRTALFGLLDWSVVAVGYLLVAHGAPAGDERTRPDQDERRPEPPIPWSGTMVLLLSKAGEELRPPQPLDGGAVPPVAAVPVPPIAAVPVTPVAAVPPPNEGPASVETGERPPPDAGAVPAAATVPPLPDGQAGAATGERPAQPDAPDVAMQAALVRRLRDDGDIARWLGRPVRGNFLPLLPAVLGLAATATLAFLGLRGLPTYLFLAPALIMVLLAAPGSSNPHTARLDWLVPPVLLGWQLLYLAAVGKAVGVPGPVTFATITALLLWYADLAFPGHPVLLTRSPATAKPGTQLRSASERGRALGWEGRTLALGLLAAAGIGMFAYLTLTAYLTALIALKVLATRSAWVAPPASRGAAPESVRR